MKIHYREKIKELTAGLIKDPERFFLEKYYDLNPPKGFRIELYIARKFKQIRNDIQQYQFTHFPEIYSWREKTSKAINSTHVAKIKSFIASKSYKKSTEDVFCRYCEKRVIPKSLHKLDFGDVVLVLFTAGLWAIFLFVIYLVVKRCPYCNLSLKRVKPIPEDKKTKDV